MFWHIFNVVAVFNKSICIDSVLVSLLEAFCKYSWIFIVKDNEDAVETTAFFCIFPVAFITFGPKKELENSQLTPIAKAIFVFPKALSTNTFFRYYSFFLQPVDGNASIKLAVIISLKGQPASLNFIWVSELNPLQ